jgi:hypothetical protein
MGEFSLADIVQIIGFGNKTGKLYIEDPAESRHGNIFFEEGRIVHAIENGTAGEDAAKSLLTMEAGMFEFVPGEVTDEKTLMINSHELLMRLAQGMDEAAFTDGGGFLEDEPEVELDIQEIKDKLKEVLKSRLGRKAKRAFSAIDGADDSIDALIEACERVEKYIALFLDEQLAEEIGGEMRGVIGF